ncbi:MAG: tetratricopeptide repeat protein [Gammaproteobacteria bacterium]|nr:tetratricopeptide repeat protein [Gammaproteobacteria bacterium]
MALIVVGVVWWLRLSIGTEPPVPESFADLDPLVQDVVSEALDYVRSTPGSTKMWMQLGLVYEANGLKELAQKCYLQVVSMQDSNTQAWYRLALVQDALGEDRRAMDALQRMLQLDESYAPSHWRIGLWQLRAGKLEQARGQFTRSLELEPNNRAARVGLARVELSRGQPQEAATVLESLLGEQPDDAYVHQLLGAAYRELGRHEEAASQSQLGHGAKPDYSDPWAEEVRSYMTGYNRVMRSAQLALQSGRSDEAVQALERLYQRMPSRVPVAYNLSLAYIAADRAGDAIRVSQEAMARRPQSVPLHVCLSLAFEADRDLGQALTVVSAGLEIDPAFGPALKQKGLLLARSRRYIPAAEALQQAARVLSDDAFVLLRLGQVQLKLERWPEAVSSFEKVIADDPNLALGFEGLASAKAELGALGEAEDALGRALALGATSQARVAAIRARLDALRESANRPASNDDATEDD